MIFIKKKKTGYLYYKQQYGDPQLTQFGEHCWEQVEVKFVKDAKTGKIIARTRQVKYLGTSNGFHFYLGPKSKLGERDKAIPSFHV